MPASHGIDFHPDFQRTDQVNWDATQPYPLMAVKATEGAHVGTYEAKSGRDFLKMRERRHRGLHQFSMLYFWIIGGKSVASQVDNFNRFIKKYIGAFEPGEGYQLDYETISYSPTPTSNMAWEFIERAYDVVHREGITYCSDWMPDSPLDADLRGEFYEWREQHPTAPLWYANYSLGTGSTGGPAEIARWQADIWQWTSVARVPGWPTGVDMNEIQPKGWETLRRICQVPTSQPIEIVTPNIEEEEMLIVRMYGYSNAWLLPGGTHLAPEVVAALTAAGVKTQVFKNHPWMLQSLLHQSGIREDQLVLSGETN